MLLLQLPSSPGRAGAGTCARRPATAPGGRAGRGACAAATSGAGPAPAERGERQRGIAAAGPWRRAAAAGGCPQQQPRGSWQPGGSWLGRQGKEGGGGGGLSKCAAAPFVRLPSRAACACRRKGADRCCAAPPAGPLRRRPLATSSSRSSEGTSSRRRCRSRSMRLARSDHWGTGKGGLLAQLLAHLGPCWGVAGAAGADAGWLG
jgi:hypothetical protein